MTPLTDLRIHHLGRAFQLAFEKVAALGRRNPDDDIAEIWVSFVASHFADSGLSCPPMENPAQPWLPFEDNHVLRTEQYAVAGGGMMGGPAVDVLLQVWIDSEDVDTAYGVPMIMRRVPTFGPMPLPLWEEAKDVARQMTIATPSGRLVFFGDKGDFDLDAPALLWRATPAYVVAAHLMAGTRKPPRGFAGGLVDHFAYELASGANCDPALSGRGPSPMLDQFLSIFNVSHLLRIKIERTLRQTGQT